METIERRMYTLGEDRIFLSEKEVYNLLESHGEELLGKYKQELMERRVSFKTALFPKLFEETKRRPEEGFCFKIEIKKILDNIGLFNQERKDREEEEIRRLIIESVCAAMKEPQRYESMYLLLPKKEWIYREDECLIEDFAQAIDGYKATEVEAGLEWATRIIEADNSDQLWKELPQPFEFFQEWNTINAIIEKIYVAIRKEDAFQVDIDLWSSPLEIEKHYCKKLKENQLIPYLVVKSL